MRRALLPFGLVVATTLVVAATIQEAREREAADPVVVPVLAGPGTSRGALTQTVEKMAARLDTHPTDGAAVVRMADALIRLQRVNNDGRAVITAEARLRDFLRVSPGHYEAERMLASVLLSQHRFGEAIAQAQRVSAWDPRDAWNYGAIGDGYLELGDYSRAFAAFDRMGAIKPGPAAYARTAYALELKGDLAGALDQMHRASAGATPNDEESQAWHFAQVGLLELQLGRLGNARREFEHALATFPGHPLAMDGVARIKIVEGDLAGARQIYQGQLARVPTPDLAALVGDLMAALGDAAGAERYYRMSEQIEQAASENGAPQPQALARFLSERNRDIPRAVTLAEEAAAARRDIFTMDSLAWSYFRAGRLPEAKRASEQALRTGTRDARLLYHAAEIFAASGDVAAARATLDRIHAPKAVADLHVARGLAALRARL